MQRTEHQVDLDRRRAIDTLAGLLDGIPVAILVTSDGAGRIDSRPMASQATRFDGTLWFFISASGRLARQLRANRNVLLNYTDPTGRRYISVSGVASVLRDSASAHDLWSPSAAARFPAGPDDADLALLSVAVQQAEYWETPGDQVRVVQVINQVIGGLQPESMNGSQLFTGAMDA